jgi:CubicO group peptidase (beta-lactamase class C family)
MKKIHFIQKRNSVRTLSPIMKVVLFVIMASFVSIYAYQARSRAADNQSLPDYWPTKGWKSCTPEEQGLDSAKLAEGLQTIREKKINIHSLLIIRNGQIVVDAAFYPYDGKTVHDFASVTKSLITTLIGIAIDQGKLTLDQPMVSFFPGCKIANLDAQKEKITVRHLASMSSGLDSLGLEADEGTLTEMQANKDWIQFALDRKVVSEPGTHFVYDSPGMHLLSAILQQATGMTALEFARQNFFEPLGIQDVIWPSDPQGFTRGWGDVHLYPRDAAKLGYLWHNKGVWEGKQLVSREWVENSVKTQIKTGDEEDYGYGWWVLAGTTEGEYAAMGRGGQRIQVVPALNIIIVTTGCGFDIDDIMPFLIPALVDPNKPLPANPTGMVEFNNALAKVLQAPAPQPVTPLPDIAKAISGKAFVIDPNPIQLKTLRLDFNDSAEAKLYITFNDNSQSSPILVGLDGIYRILPGDFNLPQGFRGYWADTQTFVLEIDEIANNSHTIYRMLFQNEKIIIQGKETSHSLSLTVEGKMQNP